MILIPGFFNYKIKHLLTFKPSAYLSLSSEDLLVLCGPVSDLERGQVFISRALIPEKVEVMPESSRDAVSGSERLCACQGALKNLS